MEHSEHIGELSAALSKAQSQMGSALKDAENPAFKRGNKVSTYADLASVITAAKKPLSENGLAYSQWPEQAEGGVALVTMLSHSSGQWMKGTTFIPASKHDAHGYGSAITYAKRFALQAVCGLPSDDDDGNAAVATAPPKPLPATPTAGLWEAMGEEEQVFLQGIVDKARVMLEDGAVADAVAYIKGEKLTADEQAAMWTRFGSKERSAMKAVTSGARNG